MYVSQRDIDVIAALIDVLDNEIEGGAEDLEYWLPISHDAHRFFEKMKNQRAKDRFRSLVKKEITKLKKDNKNFKSKENESINRTGFSE